MHQIVKKLGFKLIASGPQLPENALNRYQELMQLKELLSTLQINCVLDVGANRGQFAHALRGIGYQGHIISFEPAQREFALLADSFKGDRRWQGHQLALGSENTSATLYVIPQLTVMSSLLKMTHKPPGLKVETVSVKRLDELFPSLLTAVPSPRVFLKLDTEGYDLEVFRGAAGCLTEIKGLQSEIWVENIHQGAPRYLESLAAYERTGFALVHLTVVSRGFTGSLQAMNCLLWRPE